MQASPLGFCGSATPLPLEGEQGPLTWSPSPLVGKGVSLQVRLWPICLSSCRIKGEETSPGSSPKPQTSTPVGVSDLLPLVGESPYTRNLLPTQKTSPSSWKREKAVPLLTEHKTRVVCPSRPPAEELAAAERVRLVMELSGHCPFPPVRLLKVDVCPPRRWAQAFTAPRSPFPKRSLSCRKCFALRACPQVCLAS